MAAQARKRFGRRLDRVRFNLQKLARRIDNKPDHPRSGVDNNQTRTQIAFNPLEAKTCAQIQRRHHLTAHEHYAFNRGMSIRNGSNVVDHLDLLHKTTAHTVRRAGQFEEYEWFHLCRPSNALKLLQAVAAQ